MSPGGGGAEEVTSCTGDRAPGTGDRAPGTADRTANFHQLPRPARPWSGQQPAPRATSAPDPTESPLNTQNPGDQHPAGRYRGTGEPLRVSPGSRRREAGKQSSVSAAVRAAGPPVCSRMSQSQRTERRRGEAGDRVRFTVQRNSPSGRIFQRGTPESERHGRGGSEAVRGGESGKGPGGGPREARESGQSTAAVRGERGCLEPLVAGW
ncbi:uncharacterized protein LOC115385572 [Salarias fasciatus]|uniref:uncharacterized protein LOC115385572 n=1 Tax=Salarias fasciatus TaxID=181472 RepID=UPI001176D43B|nr:uncharacterized protein LOC115385572 [Salarias fasciatus]